MNSTPLDICKSQLSEGQVCICDGTMSQLTSCTAVSGDDWQCQPHPRVPCTSYNGAKVGQDPYSPVLDKNNVHCCAPAGSNVVFS